MAGPNYWQLARGRKKSGAADDSRASIAEAAAALFRKQPQQMQLPEVTGVAGMPDGFIMGSTTHPADDRIWEVITHPDTKEYSVRQQGCDNTTGLIITFPEAFAAAMAIKHGVAFDQKAPPPELAHVQGALIVATTPDKMMHAMSLQQLVTAVLDHVPPEGSADAPPPE